MMDNRIFNVNGRGDEMLLDTLKLVFVQKGDRTTCKAWITTEEHGLILLWYKGEGFNSLPSPLNAEQCLPFVSEWLKSEDAKKTKLGQWDEDFKHDGHNGAGWRVYCEDWGYVANHHAAICAIKPVFLWYGK